jgi:hypothetical protein
MGFGCTADWWHHVTIFSFIFYFILQYFYFSFIFFGGHTPLLNTSPDGVGTRAPQWPPNMG